MSRFIHHRISVAYITVCLALVYFRWFSGTHELWPSKHTMCIVALHCTIYLVLWTQAGSLTMSSFQQEPAHGQTKSLPLSIYLVLWTQAGSLTMSSFQQEPANGQMKSLPLSIGTSLPPNHLRGCVPDAML
jgi:hypothetical protein